MTWTAISSDRYDAGKPVSHVLAADIVDDIEDLDDREKTKAVASEYGSIENAGAPSDNVLDTVYDWRDRYITVFGYIGVDANLAAAGATDIPGGATDDQIGSDYSPLTVPSSGPGEIGNGDDAWFYSEGGGADKTVDPKLDWTTAQIWVRSSDGALMLSHTRGGVGSDSIVWGISVIGSPKTGAV
jgi:hypothetical protein